VRILDTVPEFVEAFRLRYEVYGALGYLQSFNDAKLEIDEWDWQSVPFGAFDPVSGEMIGTLRLITHAGHTSHSKLIRQVLDDVGDGDLKEQTKKRRRHLLPSMISDVIVREVQSFNSDGFVVQELSRTIVRPSHRGAGVSRALMELGIAQAARFAPTVLIGGCLPQHLPMYAKYGYQKLPNTSLDLYDSVGQVAVAVVCRTDILPQPTAAHVDELLRAMEAGATEHRMAVSAGSDALYRLAAPGRRRRRTVEF
jgi:predicted GNAT family N-acyltransferase